MAMPSPFLSSHLTLSSFPSSLATPKKLLSLCKAFAHSPPLSTRRTLSITAFLFSFSPPTAAAAILEADDDQELLEKVKNDRKRRIQRQGLLNSSFQEKGYLQDLVYKLSIIGRAIDNNDLSTATSLLGAGGTTNTDWLKKANVAFTKLSSSPEEKTEVDTFNSSLASLISSVTQNDIVSSKVHFVSSASAFEKWIALTGLVEQLKGL